MRSQHWSNCFLFLCVLSVLISSFIEGKAFGFGRGGGFKGGSSGRSGIFRGSSGYHRGSSYGGYMSKPRSSNFKKNAMTFAAGAAGAAAAYSIMRSLTRSHRYRSGGHYGQGYGDGETCVNHEMIDGVVFGRFRCPLRGFPSDARYCCGEYGKQFCCTWEASRQYSSY